jgi:phospholipid transport system substrate-binding protein
MAMDRAPVGSARKETTMLFKKLLATLAFATTALLGAGAAQAQTAPDAFVRQLSNDVLDAVKGDKAIQAGDVGRIRALVDSKVMPHVNFARMTASAVGPQWRSATPEQQKRLSDEFKQLLVNTYSGALTQVKDQTVQLKPLRAAPTDTELVVRTEIKGKGEPIQLDYRLEKAGDGWKIYDLNVLGLWLVDSYRSQFAKDLSSGGVDNLIAKLAEKNKASAGGAKS